jgi:hypothetical protein
MANNLILEMTHADEEDAYSVDRYCASWFCGDGQRSRKAWTNPVDISTDG